MNTNTFCLVSEDFIFDDLALINYLNMKPKCIPYGALIFLQDHSMTPKIPQTEEWLINLNNSYFYKLFRMERSTFYTFVNAIRKSDDTEVLSRNYKGGHFPITAEHQILIFLKYLSSQDTLLSIGNSFKISAATAMAIINKILFFVLKVKKHFIKFPATLAEFQTVSDGFSKYPGTYFEYNILHFFFLPNINNFTLFLSYI